MAFRPSLLFASTNFLTFSIAMSPSDLLPIVGSTFVLMPNCERSRSLDGAAAKSAADREVSISLVFLLTTYLQLFSDIFAECKNCSINFNKYLHIEYIRYSV